MPTIRLYLWPHRLLLLGRAFETGMHRHHAAQISFGVDGPLRMRSEHGSNWLDRAGFYVPPDCPHEFAARTTNIASVYIEAESSDLAALRQSALMADGIAHLVLEQPKRAQLQELVAVGGTIEHADETCRSVLGLSQAPESGRMLDPRIVQCLRIIQAQLDQPLRLAALATSLQVSESWLAHRFSDEVGLPLRRYVQWQRLKRAVAFALQGATLTEAAHAAGFSDSAHLSRAFRETFGVTPSFLFAHRQQLDVHLSTEDT